ncbi:7648_t:CDS:2, partial [Dentiscutata heterogama]
NEIEDFLIQTDNSDDNWEIYSNIKPSQVKELKKENKFSISRFIEEIDQETGRWKQNPNANKWNSLFVKDEIVKARVYKIITAEALDVRKELRIRDEIIAA